MEVEIQAENGGYLKGHIQSVRPDGALITYELDVLPSKVVPFAVLRLPPAPTSAKPSFKEGDMIEVYGKSSNDKEPHLGWYPAKLSLRKGKFLLVDYQGSTSTTGDVVSIDKGRLVNQNKNFTDGLNSFKKAEIPVPKDLHEYSRTPNAAHKEFAAAVGNCIVDYDHDKSQLVIMSCYEQNIRGAKSLADEYFESLKQKNVRKRVSTGDCDSGLSSKRLCSVPAFHNVDADASSLQNIQVVREHTGSADNGGNAMNSSDDENTPKRTVNADDSSERITLMLLAKQLDKKDKLQDKTDKLQDKTDKLQEEIMKLTTQLYDERLKNEEVKNQLANMTVKYLRASNSLNARGILEEFEEQYLGIATQLMPRPQRWEQFLKSSDFRENPQLTTFSAALKEWEREFSEPKLYNDEISSSALRLYKAFSSQIHAYRSTEVPQTPQEQLRLCFPSKVEAIVMGAMALCIRIPRENLILKVNH